MPTIIVRLELTPLQANAHMLALINALSLGLENYSGIGNDGKVETVKFKDLLFDFIDRTKFNTSPYGAMISSTPAPETQLGELIVRQIDNDVLESWSDDLSYVIGHLGAGNVVEATAIVNKVLTSMSSIMGTPPHTKA